MQQDQPTIAEPKEGIVYIVVNDRQIQVAKAEYWIDTDSDVFTIRSREFDCFASGSTFNDALTNFGRAVFDYADALENRVDEGTATVTEQETLKLLSGRLSRIYLEQRRLGHQRKRRTLLRRRSRNDDQNWKAVVA